MKISSKQNVVFNRTGRVEIPNSYVRRRVEPGQIIFDGLHDGDWKNAVNENDLADSLLYIDIRSLLFLQREKLSSPMKVFDPNWEGVGVDVPNELTTGDHRVKLQVTIALPPGHSDAGKIIAQSSEVVIVEGPNDTKGKGSSLLPVRPSVEDIPDLSRLEISEAEGPILYVNAKISSLSWKELASEPTFKYGMFSNCVREVLRYLAFNPGCQNTWGAAWLELEGIKGRDVPDVEDAEDLSAAWEDINSFADEACEGFLQQVDLQKRFTNALARGDDES